MKAHHNHCPNSRENARVSSVIQPVQGKPPQERQRVPCDYLKVRLPNRSVGHVERLQPYLRNQNPCVILSAISTGDVHNNPLSPFISFASTAVGRIQFQGSSDRHNSSYNYNSMNNYVTSYTDLSPTRVIVGPPFLGGEENCVSTNTFSTPLTSVKCGVEFRRL